jgi:hypothetical protein
MFLADIIVKCPPRVSIGQFLGFEKGAREPGGHQTGRIAVTRKVDLNAISTAESFGMFEAEASSRMAAQYDLRQYSVERLSCSLV